MPRIVSSPRISDTHLRITRTSYSFMGSHPMLRTLKGMISKRCLVGAICELAVGLTPTASINFLLQIQDANIISFFPNGILTRRYYGIFSKLTISFEICIILFLLSIQLSSPSNIFFLFSFKILTILFNSFSLSGVLIWKNCFSRDS